MTLLKRRPYVSSLRAGLRAGGPGPLHATMPPRRRSKWFGTALAALIVLLGMLSMGRTAAAQSPMVSPLQGGEVYLPMISANAVSAANQTCELNAREEALFKLVAEDPGQQRREVRCNPVLARVARERAIDMATRGYFSHVNPDGYGPNYLVRAAGYKLPDWYDKSDGANNIESIGGGYTDAWAVFRAWLSSEYHHIHVLGTVDFYAEQEEIGIGFYADENSPYGTYWVFISAPKE
jgi:uncharacterized protein YkwD